VQEKLALHFTGNDSIFTVNCGYIESIHLSIQHSYSTFCTICVTINTTMSIFNWKKLQL